MYKLGKNAAVIDKRTIKLSTILKTLPPYPDTFDVDSQYPGLKDNHQFANGPDRPAYGD